MSRRSRLRSDGREDQRAWVRSNRGDVTSHRRQYARWDGEASPLTAQMLSPGRESNSYRLITRQSTVVCSGGV